MPPIRNMHAVGLLKCVCQSVCVCVSVCASAHANVNVNSEMLKCCRNVRGFATAQAAECERGGMAAGAAEKLRHACRHLTCKIDTLLKRFQPQGHTQQQTKRREEQRRGRNKSLPICPRARAGKSEGGEEKKNSADVSNLVEQRGTPLPPAQS